jgi:hypothetical protein
MECDVALDDLREVRPCGGRVELIEPVRRSRSESDEQRCVRDAGPLLEELAGHLARDWLAQT